MLKSPTAFAALAYDMNGNDTVDWKDVQILEQFFGFAAPAALAGRIVPMLPIQADTDLNGVVDFADLQPWVDSDGFRSAVIGGGVPVLPGSRSRRDLAG